MTYDMGVRENRMAHEYRNLATGEFEVIRKHRLYDVVETFLTPEGTILCLAHNETASQPYAVGIYNSGHGVHWADPHDARRYYAWQIAESFGLVVDKEGSKAVLPVSREHATDLVRKIKQNCVEWRGFAGDVPPEEAGDRLAEHAASLGKHLQRIGVLSAPVFEPHEVAG
ncbi:hypothetical protein [Streptomyces sp. NPDC055036]